MKNKPFIIHPSPSSQRDRKALEKRRLKAARLFEKGVRQAEVARRVTVSRMAVHYWYITWLKNGKEGLQSSGRPGPHSALTPEKLKRITGILIKGPMTAGYVTNLWTLRRVSEVIRKTTHASCCPSYAWYILRALGWSCQKPETRYRNRNETAIKRWKKEQWPAIQKRG